jgi:hypothetical protein
MMPLTDVFDLVAFLESLPAGERTDQGFAVYPHRFSSSEGNDSSRVAILLDVFFKTATPCRCVMICCITVYSPLSKAAPIALEQAKEEYVHGELSQGQDDRQPG